MSELCEFYRGQRPDARGRTLEELQALSERDLERIHDFVQWLFPLPEPSAYNPDAPLLSASDMAEFRADPALRARLLASLDVMLRFYGFERAAHDPRAVAPGPAFPARAAAWITRANHNFLRLTRILRSLTLLGAEPEARALLAALERVFPEHADLIGQRTLDFWRDAVRA